MQDASLLWASWGVWVVARLHPTRHTFYQPIFSNYALHTRQTSASVARSCLHWLITRFNHFNYKDSSRKVKLILYLIVYSENHFTRKYTLYIENIFTHAHCILKIFLKFTAYLKPVHSWTTFSCMILLKWIYTIVFYISECQLHK